MPSDDFELVEHYAPDVARQLRALEALLSWPPLDAPAPPAQEVAGTDEQVPGRTQDTPSEKEADDGP